MRLFNNVLSCVIAFLLFTFPGRLEPQETKIKREGPVYRSVFLGEDENLRVEITSAVFAREGGATDASKTYIYSCIIKNGGEKKVKLGLLSFPDRPGSSPVVSEFELEAGRYALTTVESKAKPKIVPISQIVEIPDGKGKWTAEGFNFSFIYVPDVPSGEKKNDSSKNNKNTV